MLQKAIRFIEEVVMPKVLRHSICGHANILRLVYFILYINVLSKCSFSDDSALNNERFAAIVMDVLSERGYHVSLDNRLEHVPVKFDIKTGEIQSDTKIIHSLNVEFPKHYIRPLEQKFN